ncbi:hypothetical protein OG792_21890 [Micromonospora sp. NBC_01699]|uniref:hypothetical protein n=1 Tax=Micromonospora sp. NBC_01699 TaxID=2975984 RepID=UPI002E280FC1|nr:hypothetical protein [Micromonospora sp. NBC_01699]
MIRHLRSVVAAAALAAGAALLVALAPTPTLAGDRPQVGPMLLPSFSASPLPTASPEPEEPYIPWGAAPCATGSLGPVEVDAQHNVTIPGQATICGTWAAKYSFTVVAFPSNRAFGHAFASNLRPYAQTGPTPVRAAFITPPAVGSTGVCLMRGVDARIVCLAVDVDAQHQITSRPVATNDPLVAKPVLYDGGANQPEPGTGFCATCVGIQGYETED